jgi:CelD/BcsL family acetyltransferase involved in cellulose biosynthesis
MRAELLRLRDLPSGELAAWAALAARAELSNPFIEPGFVTAAAPNLGVDDLFVLTVRDRGSWLAALPVREVRAWRGVPGRGLAAWRHDYGFLCTPLVAGEDIERILDALVACAAKSAPCLIIDWINAPSRVSEALNETGSSVVVERFERAAIDGSEGSPAAAISGKHRHNLRRMISRLEAQIGQLEVTDLSGDPAAPEAFLTLERSGWKGRAGTAMACEAGHARFFRELCASFAAEDRLELLTLETGERPVAMICTLLTSDTAFTFKMAFDEELAKFSPGTHLQLAFIDRLRAGERRFADSCADSDNGHMNRLWPDRRRLQSLVIGERSLASAAALAKWRAASAAVPARRWLKRARRYPARTGNKA